MTKPRRARKRKEDPVVMSADGRHVECTGCGGRYLLPVGHTVDFFVAIGRAYIKEHHGCLDSPLPPLTPREPDEEKSPVTARTRKPLDIVIPPGWYPIPVNPMDDLTCRTPEGWTAWNQWTALMEVLTEEQRALADEQGGWAMEPIAMLRAMERMVTDGKTIVAQ